MAKIGTTEKEIFSVWGKFIDVPDEKYGKRRTFIPTSPRYYRDRASKMPLDKQFCARFTSKVPTRSQAQLRYHMVLCGYIGEYNGNTTEEIHDAIMRAKFGTKRVKVGKLDQEVRQSVSESAMFPKYSMVELIQYDLELCADLEINVPTMEELGYIPDDKPYH